MVSFNTEVVIFFGTEINYLLSLKLSSLETCSASLESIVYGKCRTYNIQLLILLGSIYNQTNHCTEDNFHVRKQGDS